MADFDFTTCIQMFVSEKSFKSARLYKKKINSPKLFFLFFCIGGPPEAGAVQVPGEHRAAGQLPSAAHHPPDHTTSHFRHQPQHQVARTPQLGCSKEDISSLKHRHPPSSSIETPFPCQTENYCRVGF